MLRKWRFKTSRNLEATGGQNPCFHESLFFSLSIDISQNDREINRKAGYKHRTLRFVSEYQESF